MTHPRTSPYMYVTWIPRYLTDDKSCLFAAWFKANHQGYAKMPSDFNSAKWNMEHTDLMNELVAELEERGCELFIEQQNSFRVESARSGAVTGGKPDVIAVHPDGRKVIYDAKTGQEAASHIVQVQLYMYLLPRSQTKRWRGRVCGRQREAHFHGQRGRCVRCAADRVHAKDDLGHAAKTCA